MGSCFDNTAKWIDALGRPTDISRMQYCEDQNGTIIYMRAVQGHSHGAKMNPNSFSLTKILISWREHMFRTGSYSNFKSILENGPWAECLSLRSTSQACFFSPLNPQESSSTADDRLDTSSCTKNGSKQHSDRPRHDCIYYFTLRRTQLANLVFHLGSSGDFFVRQDASKRTGQGCHCRKRSFCSTLVLSLLLSPT